MIAFDYCADSTGATDCIYGGTIEYIIYSSGNSETETIVVVAHENPNYGFIPISVIFSEIILCVKVIWIQCVHPRAPPKREGVLNE